jgi:hypothetical protein
VGAGTYDDTHPAWTYTGNWTAYTGNGPANNTMHYSSTIGDFATLDFQGTGFVLTHTANFNRGQVQVYVDDVLEGTLDEYNPTVIWQKTTTGSTVADDTHVLKLVHFTGTYIDIDAIRIIGPLLPGIYDDTNNAWTYTGNWTAYSGPGPANNTMHYSSTIGDFATLDFQGNQFILTHTANFNRGQVQVYIDDVLEGTLDEYNPTVIWQKTTTGPTVTDDSHTLKLVHSTGTYIDIDAIQVIAP